MEVHGFGNWEEISVKIGDGKTAFDVEKHFYDCYINYLDDFDISKANEIIENR